jgi:hypothetical protein
MRNARFRSYWMQAEEKEWQGLWDKGVFKKWSRKDLLSKFVQSPSPVHLAAAERALAYL